MENEGIAEGVFTASGKGSGCYTVTAYIHQTPEEGRKNYVIQVNGHHNAAHNCNGQILTLNFNQAVTNVTSQGSLVGGSGTSSIQIKYSYFNNNIDNIGLGDIYVESASGLQITSASLDDSDYHC